jgi:hypothetical protein
MCIVLSPTTSGFGGICYDLLQALSVCESISIGCRELIVMNMYWSIAGT